MGKTEVIGVKRFPVPQCPAQFSHRQRWKMSWAYVKTGREISAGGINKINLMERVR